MAVVGTVAGLAGEAADTLIYRSMVSGDDPNAPGPQQYTLLAMLGRHVRQKLGGHAQFSLRSARSRKATPPV